MRKHTSKELKELINSGLAIDITNAHSRDAINEPYRQVGYRSGTIGIMGGSI